MEIVGMAQVRQLLDMFMTYNGTLSPDKQWHIIEISRPEGDAAYHCIFGSQGQTITFRELPWQSDFLGMAISISNALGQKS